MRARLAGGIAPSVRMLCSRSASLTTMMRTSSVMARNSCFRSTADASAAVELADGACWGSGQDEGEGAVVEEEEGAAATPSPSPFPPPPPAPGTAAWVVAAAAAPVSAAASRPSLENLVSPSTMRRTPAPNQASISSKETASVSSTVSCNSPAATLSASMPSSARMRATSTGWVM